MAEQRETRDRRMQILEAAVTLFAERGYQRATVKEIAARAGIAPGTIYLYFRNKRELLLALAETLFRRAAENLLASGSERDVESHLALVLRDRLRFVRENQELLRALATEIWTAGNWPRSSSDRSSSRSSRPSPSTFRNGSRKGNCARSGPQWSSRPLSGGFT